VAIKEVMDDLLAILGNIDKMIIKLSWRVIYDYQP